MDVISVFDTVTGTRLGRLPASSWSWSREVNDSGSLSVKVPLSQDTVGMNLRTLTRPWATTLAVISQGRVLAAGPVYQRDWDSDSQTLALSCGGFLDLLKRRLVIPHTQLSYTGGTIEADDGEYPTEWNLSYNGSLADIVVRLVEETLEAGDLPVVLPPLEGGTRDRSYAGPDLATVATRIEDLCDVDGGPEVMFDPRLADNGARLQWHLLHGTPELVLAEHSWDMRSARSPVTSLTISEDASDMTGDAWAKGGSQQDKTLLAHYRDTWLEQKGWPLLQATDSNHSSVSELDTLTGYTKAMTLMRSRSLEVVNLKARRLDEEGFQMGDAVSAGDHLRLRLNDPYVGASYLDLKVLEVSGDESEWVSLACREVIS